MGTTLYAIVETKFLDGPWQDVSRWDFGKAYEVMRVVREVADDGWPSDLSVVASDAYSADVGGVGSKYWIELDLLKAHMDEQQWHDVTLRALMAGLDVFEAAGMKTRVLFEEWS